MAGFAYYVIQRNDTINDSILGQTAQFFFVKVIFILQGDKRHRRIPTPISGTGPNGYTIVALATSRKVSDVSVNVSWPSGNVYRFRLQNAALRNAL